MDKKTDKRNECDPAWFEKKTGEFNSNSELQQLWTRKQTKEMNVSFQNSYKANGIATQEKVTFF
jgi:hypothetical protein